MFEPYINAIYLDWLRNKSNDELIGVIRLIAELLERKGYSVIGTLDVYPPKKKADDKGKENGA